MRLFCVLLGSHLVHLGDFGTLWGHFGVSLESLLTDEGAWWGQKALPREMDQGDVFPPCKRDPGCHRRVETLQFVEILRRHRSLQFGVLWDPGGRNLSGSLRFQTV